MSRTSSAICSFAAFFICTSASLGSRAQTADAIPEYFFDEWIIGSDCSEAHAGPQGHVRQGLKYRIRRSSAAADGKSFAFEAVNSVQTVWPGRWPELRLEYRAGTKMSSLPADFECIPGSEASSPFLAMGGYSVSAEPWYEHEHWYGLVTIHGEAHHVLIFPRNAEGPASAVIVLHDADASDGIQLDHDGVIHSRNN